MNDDFGLRGEAFPDELQAVRQREKVYRQLLDNIELAITVLDRDLRIEMLNAKSADYLHRPPEDCVGRLLSEVYPALGEQETEQFESVFTSGEAFSTERLIDLPNGERRWFAATLQPVKDPRGEIVAVQLTSEDITDRKRIEEELRESRERYKGLYDNAQAGLGRTRISDGKLLEANQRLADMFGYESIDEILREFHSLNHYVDLSARDRVLDLLRKSGEVEAFETEYTRKDGSSFWGRASLRMVPVRGYVEGVIVDVTEGKLAEGRLRESEAKYRTLLENLPQRVFLKDTDSVYISCNENYARDLKIEPADITGKTDFDFHSKELAEKYRADDRRVMTTGCVEEIEDDYSSNSERRVVQTVKTAVTDEGGNTTGVLGIFWDITERKRAEEALRESEEKFRVLSDQSLMGIHIISGGVVRYVNSATAAICGYSIGELMRWKPGELAKLIHPDDRDFVMEQAAKKQRGDRDVVPNYQWRLVSRSGETKWIESFSKTITFGDELADFVMMIDISERVHLQEMMIQSEKMLSLGGLAAGMAHEINNPLAGILQNVQVMRNRMTGAIAKDREAAEASGTTIESVESYMRERGLFRMIDSVVESAQRAKTIIDNFLSFSRKSDAKIELRNLGELLDQSIDLVENDYDSKKKLDFRQIEIHREYEENLPRVPCDPSKIQQVFLNLLKNGAQAMMTRAMDQSVEDVRTNRFVFRAAKEREFMRVEIEDNGPGMSEGVRRRVFEPFFTTKGAGIGTGLGLSVSYFIITQNHGGTMTVESQPGAGAKFIIRLPLVRRHTGSSSGSAR